MDKPSLVKAIETRFAKRPIAKSEVLRNRPPDCRTTAKTVTVAVVGGGIAGPAFVRRLLTLAEEARFDVEVVLLSRPSCNYCGGLITNLSLQTMRGLYRFEPAKDVVLSTIDEVVFINRHGSERVAFDAPLMSVFRTSRFGQTGFDDDFRHRILEGMNKEARRRLTAIEPCSATEIHVPQDGRRGRVVYHDTQGRHEIEADLVIVATGLRSLNTRLMRDFCASTGFVPPPMMDASVTEIDLAGTGRTRIGNRMLVLNGIIDHCVAAMIPKMPNWITVCSLERALTSEDLARLCTHPAVKEYVELEDLPTSLPCGRICPSGVYIGPAKGFYGDGWAVVGDLTGYGRVLKDGYFAALLGAELVAHTIVDHGWTKKALAENYHRRLLEFRRDNRAGLTLFRLNSFLHRSDWFNLTLLEALRAEKSKHEYGGLVHTAFRALSTGELSYSLIAALLVAGLVVHVVKHPISTIRPPGTPSAGRSVEHDHQVQPAPCVDPTEAS